MENDVTSPRTSGRNFHAVQFYKDAVSLGSIVANFLGEGFRSGQPAIVIATVPHRAEIVKQLQSASFDARALQEHGDLILLDADDTLASFMVDGMPHPERFTRAIVPVIEQACRGRKECVIRAYGEMVDVLWKGGQTMAATRLEMLWNQLARTHDFSLLCGYCMGNFYKDAAVDEICGHHNHVLPPVPDVSDARVH